ncbi:MAG: CHAT domain-containing tetratricopeptide repeat protein [Microscillaceae bacterium]|nr:CHAT domain-containing tetratricopeptide repeat protein [Microscillaceae bacterium]
MSIKHKKAIFITSILLGLVIFYQQPTHAQISWANMFVKYDKQVYKGKYAQTIAKKNKKIPKLIQKKFGGKEAYMIWADIYEADLWEALAQYGAMNQKIESILPRLESIKDNDLESYTVGVCKLADIYLEMSRFSETEIMLKELKSVWETRATPDEVLLAEIDLRLITAQVFIGKLNESLAKLPDLQERWQKLSTMKTSLLGQLSSADIAYRNAQYARTLTLGAQLFSEKGAYSKADSVFRLHENTVARLAGANPLNARHIIAKADNAFANEDYQNAEKYYENALSKLKSTQKEFMLAQSKAILTYIYRDKEAQVNKAFTQWPKLTKVFSKNENYYDILGSYIDSEQAFKAGNIDNAKEILKNILAKPAEVLPQYHPLKLAIYEEFYGLNTLGEKPDFVEAKKNIESLMEISKALMGESSLSQMYYQVKMGDYYLQYSTDFDKAKKIFETEPYKPLFEERVASHRQQVNLNNAVANYYDVVDRYQDALDLMSKSAEAIKNKYGDKSLEYGLQLIKVADFSIKVGKYREAEANMSIALPIIRKEARKRSIEYADALSTMAKIYGIFGMYEEARKLLNTSDRIYKKLDVTDFTKRSNQIEELAFLYIRLGEYAETEEILNILLEDKTKKYGADNRQLIQPLNQLGLLYLIKGDYAHAAKLLDQAESISRKIYGDQSIRTASTFAIQAEYYTTIGDYERADEYNQHVIDIQKKQLGENHVELGQSFIKQALIKFYEDPKNAPESESYLEKAKQIMASNFDTSHPLYAEVLKNTALIYIETQRYQEAFQLLNQANAIWLEKLGERNLNSAYVYSLMGDVYVHLKKFDEARLNYEKAESIYKKLLSKNHPDYVQTESKMGRMYFISADYKEANRVLESTTASYLNYIKTYFPSLSEREKAKFWNKIQSDFEFFNTLAIKQAEERPELIEKMYDFRLATKAILLSSSIRMRQSILNGTDEELKNIFQEWTRKKEELTALLSMSEEQMLAEEINPEILSNEINNIEKTLSERSDIFANNVRNELPSWKDVRKTLKDGESAIEIIRYRQYEDGFTNKVKYAALIVNKDTRKNPKLVVLEDGAELEDKFLRYYRNMVRFQKNDQYSYKKYWQPIEEALGEEKNVVFLSPDGVYNQLNIESFLIEKGNYVIDQTNIRLVSNTKDLMAHRLDKSATSLKPHEKIAFFFGNPKFYTSQRTETEALGNKERGTGEYVSQLPGTEVEISLISEMLRNRNWNVNVFKDSEAAENALKGTNSPTILHIATHGFFHTNTQNENISTENNLKALQNDPLRRSGLLARGAGDLLAKETQNFDREEGILTANEAMSMNLDHTDLVILSACETGLGEVAIGEGVYGLQRAFLVAGADALIMSLFKVNDEATQKLMTKFYEKWLETGDRRKAFLDAQKIIREEYPHPTYWGVFNMIGVD